MFCEVQKEKYDFINNNPNNHYHWLIMFQALLNPLDMLSRLLLTHWRAIILIL